MADRRTTRTAAAAGLDEATGQHVIRLVCAALALAMGVLAMRIAGLW